QVVATLAVRVPLAVLHRGFDYPDTMQLPALALRIEEVLVLEGHLAIAVVAGNLEGVVGDIHLLLAHQLHVPAIHLAAEQVDLVTEQTASRAGLRSVIGSTRRG